MSKRIRILVLPDLAEIVPLYLKARRQETATFAGFLQAADYHEIGTIGHNLKGNGTSYGFTELSRIGAQVEESARAMDRGAIAVHLARLDEYLSSVDLVNS